ncbi:hypothetical protein HJC23_003847 [Cyclotella cryptica]|uniref:Uncharacterized protein n=1 Tax=Cyclotella cryptica TaxID=29204 RepID=A0ABD3PZZ3_9STRA|eukprot:CCRYP_010004-RA/>CCRYP_010004-RA protein AED:0.02 eAED:0.02 QI:444/1/1/1/0/0/2/43/524
MCEVDNQGRCAKHAFVQVKRLSRSGEWKSLLDICPLCAMDGGADGSESLALVPLGSSSSEGARKYCRVKFAQEAAGFEVRKDYQFRPPSSNNLQCLDSDAVSVSSGHSGHSSVQRSALKTPKYKACPNLMREQSKSDVTTMSMDLDIEEDSESEDEASEQQQSQQIPLPPKQTKRKPPPPPRRQSRHKEEKSKVNPRVIGKSPVRSSIRRSTNSTSENPPIQGSRPDPEEFSHNAHVCTESQVREERRLSNSSGPFIMTRDVSDEVSAISFMGSVYSNTQPHFNVNSLVPYQENELMPEESNDFDFDNDDQDICISTNNYDSKGRCVKHPHVRLRKKKIFGRGWKVLMSACPDCCVDELRRIKSEASKKNSTLKSNSTVEQVTKKVLPRSSINDKESDDTASLSTSSQGSVNMDQVVPVVAKKDQEGIFVKNMMWTDINGRRGAYTGEVDAKFIPNGQGSMMYEDGTVNEGEWKHGGIKSPGRSRPRASERSSRSRSASVRPGARSRSTSVTPLTRSRSSSRAR